MKRNENNKREPIATDDANKKGKTGQDHSLENYEDSEPHDGISEIQNTAVNQPGHRAYQGITGKD